MSRTATAILGFSLSAALFAQDVGSAYSRPPKPIGEEQLRTHRFEELWSTYVPDVEMRGAWLLGDGIYFYTKRNQLVSLSATEGIVRWIVDLPREPEFPPTLYEYPRDKNTPTAVFYDEIYVVGHDALMVIDKEIGTLKNLVELNFSVSSPAWGSFSHILIGSWNDKVYAINKRNERVDWFYRTNGDIVHPGNSKEGVTLVPSDDGRVYFFDPGNGRSLATVETLGPISTVPLFHNLKAYVGSADFTVYCYNQQGSTLWRFPAGAPVKGRLVGFPARVGWFQDSSVEKIYFTNASNEIFAVRTEDAKTDDQKYRMGDLAWKAEGVSQVLARGFDNLYCRDAQNRLIALEDATGKIQFTDDLISSADYFFTNTVLPDRRPRRGIDMGGTVFVGWKNGWFIGFKEKPRY